jgi:hypothetical protein
MSLNSSGNLVVSGTITEAGSAVQSAGDLDTCAEFAALGAIETGTCGSLVMSASPTLTGTLTAAAANFSSTVTHAGATIFGAASGYSGEKLEILTNGSNDGIVFRQNSDNTSSIQAFIDGQWSARTTYASGCCNGLLLQPDVGYVSIGSTWSTDYSGSMTGVNSITLTTGASITSSAANRLLLNASDYTYITAGIFYVDGTTNFRGSVQDDGGNLTLGDNVDVTGNLNVGTPSSNPAGANVVASRLDDTGYISVNRSGGTAGFFGRTNDGTVLDFYTAGTTRGTISIAGGTVSYNGLTGSHYGLLEGEGERGELMTLTGQNDRYHGDEESEVLYGISRSMEENDPKIIGSYNSLLEPEKDRSVENPDLIMAVGNGAMWVADMGEDLEVGDYLISSNVPGHARKDPQTATTSFIIARVAEPVDWSDVSETINGVKHKRISVFFESMARDNWSVLLADLNASSTEETLNYLFASEEDTVWTRLASLAQGFVDGVLSIAGLKTDEICLTDASGETCIDRSDLNALLQNSVQPEPEEEQPPVEEPEPEPIQEPEEEEPTSTTTPEVAPIEEGEGEEEVPTAPPVETEVSSIEDGEAEVTEGGEEVSAPSV